MECLPEDCCPSTGAAEEGGLHAAGVQMCPIERGHHWEGGLRGGGEGETHINKYR